MTKRSDPAQAAPATALAPGLLRGKRLLREATFERAAMNESDRTVPLSFSSEMPVERWFGMEILSHAKGAVNLDRLSSGRANLLVNHQPSDWAGVIESAAIEDKTGRAVVRFSKSDRGTEIMQDVKDGILGSVSVAYSMDEVKLTKQSKGGPDEYTVTRWTPFEVSLVTVPADPTVGVGRGPWPESDEWKEAIEAAGRAAYKGSQPADSATTKKELRMSKKPQDDAAADPGAADNRADDIEIIDDNEAITREQQRAQAIRSMADSMQISDRRTVQGWVMSGKPLEDIANEMVKVRSERSKQAALDVGGIGLSDSEARRFSFVRAVNAVFTRDWSKAGFEAEVSKATAQRMGKMLNEHTFAVPPEVQYLTMHKRTLIAGTAAQGGDLVATDLISFIDILRVRSVALRAGVMTMGGLVGQVAIPRKTTAGSVGFIAEAGTATASELVLGQLTLTPKTLAGYQEFSKQLLMQSTPDVETLVRQDLADGIAVKIDNAVIWGTGANNPTGIRYTSGIGTANPTAGTAVVYADALRFQSTVAAANALAEGFTYLSTPAVAALLMGKPRFATTGDTPIWEGNMLDGMIAGMRALSSNQVGSGCTLAGDFAQTVLAQWAGLEVEVNPYANFQAGIVGVKATMYADVGVRQAGAYAIGTGMTG